MPTRRLYRSWILPIGPTSFLANLKSGGKYEGIVGLYRHNVSADSIGIFDREIVEALSPSVKWIAHNGAGYDQIDVQACKEKGASANKQHLTTRIVVSNTPGAVDDATATTALYLMISAHRQYALAERNIRSLKWKSSLRSGNAHDLTNRTLAILGLGGIGMRLAELARAFPMRIVYHNRHKVEDAPEWCEYFPKERLDEMLGLADVLSVHVPLKKETEGLVDERMIRKLKKGAIIVNTARGKVIDEAAMIRALEDGHLGAVGLDVYPDEPEVNPRLFDFPNATLLPHMGTETCDSQKKMEIRALTNLLDYLQKGAGKDVVPELKTLDTREIALSERERQGVSIPHGSFEVLPARSLLFNSRFQIGRCIKNKVILDVLFEIWMYSDGGSPTYIVLTDEDRASVVDLQIRRVESGVRSITVALDRQESKAPLGLRSVLGATLNQTIPSKFRKTLGDSEEATQRESVSLGSEVDAFHVLQTEWDDILQVLQEKKTAQSHALETPLQEGSVLAVEALDVHLAHSFKTVPDEVPPATSQLLLSKRRLGPSQATKDILHRACEPGGSRLSFKISKIIQEPKKDILSSVFFGLLELETSSGDKSCSDEICLKLVDDSLLPFEEEDACKVEWDSQKDSARRGLRIQNFSALEIMRNEVTVYERMERWQGTLLPYAYGAYKFRHHGGPGDSKPMLGLLTEAVQGRSIYEMHKELRDWDLNDKKRIAHYLRHVERALLYGGIKERYAHSNLVLLVLGEGDSRDFSLVMVDFATVELRLGETMSLRSGGSAVVLKSFKCTGDIDSSWNLALGDALQVDINEAWRFGDETYFDWDDIEL
ncbi:hypothetical protein EIP91_001275 [Steccherinum ochraceum]|uniref:D-isomer specific 2-hydroxyacid dehydrogenase NAD-binding domain-containing protein n=1 Tax=Steccherinum ochraceum TaxID=92696 RepID=A0A4R0RV24_9APHY|nr:hypothetical protein EIP91_001275 [Steccherinum ochraceum]